MKRNKGIPCTKPREFMKNNNDKATNFLFFFFTYRHNNNKILNISCFLNDTIINVFIQIDVGSHE